MSDVEDFGNPDTADGAMEYQIMPGTPMSKTRSIQLQYCARVQATTTHVIQSFANGPNCIAFLIQDPACNTAGSPPEHHDFDLFTPTDKDPRCATYIRKLAATASDISYTY